MKQLVTKAIVLARTDYGEADRIITVLTPDQGKLRLLARGVRRIKSKLAGGIELFSVSDITYAPGRGEIGTLISSRLDQYYGRIVGSLERVQLGYDLLKLLNKATEDHPEPAYFELLQTTLDALDDQAVPLDLVHLWFTAQLIKVSGHSPNLRADENGVALKPDQKYTFDYERVGFYADRAGRYTTNHIKVLRLLFAQPSPHRLIAIRDLETQLQEVGLLMMSLRKSYITHQ